jgi:transcription antitermination factor NusG
VCWFVGDHGTGHPIPDKQIQNLQTILNSAVPYTPFPFVGIGQRIRVHGGRLEGIEGTLICTESDPTVVVSVETVRRSLAVRVNGYDLEEV